MNYYLNLISVFLHFISIVIAFIALKTWKKEIIFKRKIEILENIINQCDNYIRHYGYSTAESLYEIALNVEKDKEYFSATTKKQLENLHDKLITYCDILVKDKYIKKESSGERLDENIEMSKVVSLAKEIHNLSQDLKGISIKKLNKLYNIKLN